jgi:hypothetical protein
MLFYALRERERAIVFYQEQSLSLSLSLCVVIEQLEKLCSVLQISLESSSV